MGAGLSFMRVAIIGCLAVVLGFGGCTSAKREDLVKEVLRADPDFAQVLEKYRELSNRIETY